MLRTYFCGQHSYSSIDKLLHLGMFGCPTLFNYPYMDNASSKLLCTQESSKLFFSQFVTSISSMCAQWRKEAGSRYRHKNNGKVEQVLVLVGPYYQNGCDIKSSTSNGREANYVKSQFLCFLKIWKTVLDTVCHCMAE